MPSYKVEEPKNYQQKCLCVLLLDVSGSMRKNNRLETLNKAVQSFYNDVVNMEYGVRKKVKDSLELAIVAFDDEPHLIYKPQLISSKHVIPELKERGRRTDTVRALEYAITHIIEEQKKYYDATGQCYYRPWLILITDGRPTSTVGEIERISELIRTQIAEKRFSIMGVNIGDDKNQFMIDKLCADKSVSIDELHFEDFFKWLSRSVSNLTRSSDEDTSDIPPFNL